MNPFSLYLLGIPQPHSYFRKIDLPDKELSVDKFSFALIFKFIYVYVHHVHEVPMEARRHHISLELKLQAVMRCPTWVLTTEPSLQSLSHFE